MHLNQSIIQDLIDNVVSGNAQESVITAKRLINENFTPQQIVEQGLTKALESLGTKCNIEQFNLLEILMAARAMKEVMEKVISKELVRLPSGSYTNKLQKVFILGTIQGDIHDLGKDIVATLLKINGFKVIDLGKDVPPAFFADKAFEEKAQFIGISSLITTTIPYIREVRRILDERGAKNVLVIAGGAAMRQIPREDLNVNLVMDNAFELLYYLNSLKGEC